MHGSIRVDETVSTATTINPVERWCNPVAVADGEVAGARWWRGTKQRNGRFPNLAIRSITL